MDEVTQLSILVLAIALCLPIISAILHTSPRLLKFGKYVLLICYFAVYAMETLLFRSRYGEPKTEPLWSYRKALAFRGDGVVDSVRTGRLVITDSVILQQNLLNILLYVPMGFMLPFVWPKLERKHLVVPIGIFLSIATELMQYRFRIGCCDVDDVINNTIGCIIGVILYKLLMKRQQKTDSRKGAGETAEEKSGNPQELREQNRENRLEEAVKALNTAAEILEGVRDEERDAADGEPVIPQRIGLHSAPENPADDLEQTLNGLTWVIESLESAICSRRVQENPDEEYTREIQP